MEIKISGGSGNSVAQVQLAGNEGCVAEGGAMIAMHGDVNVTTSTHQRGKGGIMKGIKRLLSGESFFLNHFTAPANGGAVWLAPVLPGEMVQINLDGVGVIAEGGTFVMAGNSVSMDLGWQGFKSLLSGEGLFWLNLKGQGPVVLNSFGAIYTIDVDGEYVVDSGHIVAFEETLDFKISKAGKSWLTSFLGGEGFVCRFQGKGKLWCQSHNSSSFGGLLTPYLKAR